MNEETWLPTVGFDNYEVSDHGRLRNVITGRLIRSENNGPYPFVTLRQAGRSVGRSIHVLVAQAFLGDTSGFTVNHKDFDKTNNHVSNLEIVSHAENIEHARVHGRMSYHQNASRRHRVLCVETGVEFKSIRDAGWLMYISPGLISQNIRGLVPTAKGYTFVRL
jgi:hypothetical protein